jgi:signal transduction histidine kinase
MDQLSRWLGRTGSLVLIATAVIGTLFGARQLELAVSNHQESLLRSQTLVTRVGAAAADVVGQPQGVLYGARAVPWQFQTNAKLQQNLTRAAAALAAQWHDAIAPRIERQALALNAAVKVMMAFAATGRIDAAKASNARDVGRASAQFQQLVTLADTRLARATGDANRLRSDATLATAFGASILLLVMIVLFNRARRRRDLAESERRATHEAEARLRALIDNGSDVIVVAAPDSTVLYEAGSLPSVFGEDAARIHGAKLSDLVEAADVPILLAVCAGARRTPTEVRVRHPEGPLRTCEIQATNVLEDPHWKGLVLHIWDVSDRKALELELRLAQKLEAVGQLAAGIAHEINTPIQYVGDTSRFLDNSFAELAGVLDAYAELLAAAQQDAVTPALLQRVEEAEETADVAYLRERVPKACERNIEGVEHVAKIVSAMRAFAHPSLESAPVDLNETIRNILTIATNEYKYVADVSTDLGELPPIVCNSSDVNQVLLNLIVNAAHAIADVVGDSDRRGSIGVRTWLDGDEVVIAVSDDGTGIAPEIADRVFDPFFTTKDVGRGTGQGLALSRTIVVERHGGSLTFDSRFGEGTTFFVRLPVGGAGADSVPAAAAA